MDFGKIIARSLKISWKYKTLWALGFFASFIGGSSVFIGKDHETRASDFVSQHPWLLAIIIGYIILLLLFFLIMHLICTAGLIDAVSRFEKNGLPGLKESFKSGSTYFWKFLSLWLMAIVIAIVCFGLVALPIALTFWASVTAGFLFLVILIPPGFVIIFFLFSIYSLAQREIVIGNCHLFESIRNAFLLLKKNIRRNLIVFLVDFITALILFSLNTFLLLLFAIPLILMAIQSTAAVILLLLVEVPIFILIAILLTGFFGAFMNSLYTVFYMELKKMATPAESPEISSDKIAGELS